MTKKKIPRLRFANSTFFLEPGEAEDKIFSRFILALVSFTKLGTKSSRSKA